MCILLVLLVMPAVWSRNSFECIAVSNCSHSCIQSHDGEQPQALAQVLLNSLAVSVQLDKGYGLSCAEQFLSYPGFAVLS